MKRSVATITLCALASFASPSVADEGQWTPRQLAELDADELRKLGLELEPRQLWNDDGGGLMRAAVNLSGCSAAFVSERGLIATNHHCAYRAIQGQSTPEANHLERGFLAKSPGEELLAKGYTVRVLVAIRDVTARVHAAMQGKSDDRERFRAAERAQKQIVLECEKKDPALRCAAESFYLGARFELFEAIELRDIRLVYAPPAAIGEYGGDVDNWMWPRHTGDFALLRAWAAPNGKSAEHAKDNVPYRPSAHLKIGTSGVRPGDFVAVMGYPRRTNRYLPTAEVERQVDQVLPALIDLYGEWLDVLAEEKKRGEAVAIKLAALEKSLANRHKNARGMLDGIARMRLLERRRGEERALSDWAKTADRKRYGDALGKLAALAKQRRDSFGKDFLLEQAPRGPNLLAVAIDLTRRARERKKPDLERDPAYMDRNASQLWKTQERRVRDFDPKVDARLIAALAARSKRLPEPDRLRALETPATAQVLATTELSKLELVREMFDAEPERVLASADPLLVLARKLVDPIEAARATDEARSGIELAAGPLYFEMLKQVRKGAVYPDANGTLRLSYATVKGYEPRDGLIAKPQTTLSGALAKHTGNPPFALPGAVRDKAAGAKTSYWADAELGDLPLCFLSNADTTGGNSGSPVVNGKGELVGLNFDRVWENIAGDFGYSNDRSRNISVDVRYMLWLLDRVDDAGALLTELGVAELRSRPPERKASAPPPASEPKPEPKAGCAIGAPGGEARISPWLALLAVASLGRRRAAMCVRHPHS